MLSHTRRALALAVLALVAFGGFLLLAPGEGGSRVDLAFDVWVSGTIVDAATSAPVSGVWVVPMRSLGGPDSYESAMVRKQWLEIAFETGHPLRGGARTDIHGSFSFVFRITWGGRDSGSTTQETPPPFHDLEGLLLYKPTSVSVVVPTNGGTWNQHPAEPGLFASLDMGMLPVRCRE
jgi:hypothetical protein